MEPPAGGDILSDGGGENPTRSKNTYATGTTTTISNMSSLHLSMSQLLQSSGERIIAGKEAAAGMVRAEYARKMWSRKKMAEYTAFVPSKTWHQFLARVLYVPTMSLVLAMLPYMIPLPDWPRGCSFESCPPENRPRFMDYWAWNWIGFPMAVVVCWNQFTSWVFAFLGSKFHLTLFSMGFALFCAAIVSTLVYSLSAFSVYPVPIASLSAFLPGAGTTVLVLLLQIPAEKKKDPGVQARIQLFMDTSNLCPATIIVYSAYTYIYRDQFEADTWEQLLFTLLVPALRELFKLLFAHSALQAAAQTNDELCDITPSLVFGIRCFVGAFTTTIFPDAGLSAVAVIIAAELAHLGYEFYAMHIIKFDTTGEQNLHYAMKTKRLSVELEKNDPSPNSPSLNSPNTRQSKFQSAPSKLYQNRVPLGSVQEKPLRNSINRSCSIETDAENQNPMHGGNVNAKSAIINHSERSESVTKQEGNAIVTERALYAKAEDLLYEEYVENFIPAQYLLFITFAYFGYNKSHFLEFDEMELDRFQETCIFLCIAISLNLVTVRLIYLSMKHTFKIDSAKLLEFLLVKYANLLIGTNASIMVFVFGYLMKLLGDDFGFHLSWMRG